MIVIVSLVLVLGLTSCEGKGPRGLISGDLAWGEEISVEFPGGESVEFVRIEPGSFLMGTSDEQIQEWKDYNRAQERASPTSYRSWPLSWEFPQHLVTITKAFYLGKREVTRSQWFAVVDSGKEIDSPEKPIMDISWLEIQNYNVLLSERTGRSFRLPTESEWEYAARAGTTTIWWTGDDPEEAARIIVDPSYPNPWGLISILGGVWEYVLDGGKVYGTDHEINPVGPDPTKHRGKWAVLRGGDNGAYQALTEVTRWPFYARSAYRVRWYVDEPFATHGGFRLLLEENGQTSIREGRSWGEVKNTVSQ